MLHQLPIGKALRRFRRLRGIKQGHAAELLGVSQATVCRWESGELAPGTKSRVRIENLLRAEIDERADAALKRLVSTSALPVHLICDSTHRLLAASPSRLKSWGASFEAYQGTSLWRFASPEVVAAEGRLETLGWFERPYQRLAFETGANDSSEVVISPSLLQWETLPLSDGRVGRLTTTLTCLQPSRPFPGKGERVS